MTNIKATYYLRRLI